MRYELIGDLYNPKYNYVLKDGSVIDANVNDNRKQFTFEQSFKNIPRVVNGEVFFNH